MFFEPFKRSMFDEQITNCFSVFERNTKQAARLVAETVKQIRFMFIALVIQCFNSNA